MITWKSLESTAARTRSLALNSTLEGARVCHQLKAAAAKYLEARNERHEFP